MIYKIVLYRLLVPLLFFGLIACSDSSNDNNSDDNNTGEELSLVARHGQLSISGTNIVDKNNDLMVLRGMSLFWSQWGGNYYTAETVNWLVDDWKCTVVRASMGVESGGYLADSYTEYQKVKTVVDACIAKGIYVIVDWHDHNAENHSAEAISFFSTLSKEYGAHPNIIYEIYNEPLNVSWSSVIKPYAEGVIEAIRANDPDNIIVVGTRNWSQELSEVAGNKIDDANVAYSLHFYSSTHGQDLRNKAISAMNSGVPVMVTEWGMSEASGDGAINQAMRADWINFIETYNLSWCNWSIINKNESSAALKTTAVGVSGWSEAELSESGNYIRSYILEKNSDTLP